MTRVVLLGVAVSLVVCLCGCEGEDTGGDGEGASSAPSGGRGSFKVLTYNVLGDRVGMEERVPVLLGLMRDSDADVIALQEVTPWFFRKLMAEPWVEDRYHGTMIDGKFVVAGGLFILSKHPIEKTAYERLPGRQERNALVASMTVEGRRMVVGTVHLESPLEEGATRAEQLDIVFGLLKDADDTILLGDFNFGDGEAPETAHLEDTFVDMWLALRPDEAGFTWNIEKSEMAREGSYPGEESRRIDRMLVRSEVWRPASIRIIGDAPVIAGRKDLFPSDHFGLVGVLEWAGESGRSGGRAEQGNRRAVEQSSFVPQSRDYEG